MNKVLKLKEGFFTHDLTLQIGHYENGCMAILALEDGLPFGKMTINIDEYGDMVKPFQAFLNNFYYFENLLETLKEVNLVEETGIVCAFESGESYPLVTFNKEVLKEYDEDNFEEYEAYAEALQCVREMNENK